MKKVLAVFLTLVLCMMFLATAFAEDDEIVIGFCNYDTAQPFPFKVGKALQEIADEKGWTLDVTENLNDSEIVLRCLDTYLLKDVDAFVTYWLDEALVPTLQSQCDAAGIPFVLLGCEPEGTIVVSADNTEFGKQLGRRLASAVTEKWNGEFDSLLICEAKEVGALNDIRMQGVVAGIEETLDLSGIEVVYVDGGMDSLKTQQVITDAFTAHPNWERTVIAGFNDAWHAVGIASAISSLGIGDKVLAGHVQGFSDPVVYNLETYDWYVGGGEHFAAGFASVIAEQVERVLSGEQVEAGIYHVPLSFVDASNVANYDPLVD